MVVVIYGPLGLNTSDPKQDNNMCAAAIVPAFQAFMAAAPTVTLSSSSLLGSAISTGASAVASAGTWAAANSGLLSAGLTGAGLVDADQKYKVGKSDAKKSTSRQQRQTAMKSASERKKSQKSYRTPTKRPTGRRTLRVG